MKAERRLGQSIQGRCEIQQTRIRCLNRVVCEEDARHDGWVDAVIAAPCLGVVAEYIGAGTTDCRVPRYAITSGVTDDQIGSILFEWAAIDLGCLVDRLNRS